MHHIVMDTESNGFRGEATHLWCASFSSVDGIERWSYTQQDLELTQGAIMLDKFMELAKDGGLTLYCHNLFGHDLPLLNDLYGFNYNYTGFRHAHGSDPENVVSVPWTIIDTLDTSRRQMPDRRLPKDCPMSVDNPITGKKSRVSPHGLEAWGYRLDKRKPTISNWLTGDPVEYLQRCEDDVEINRRVVLALREEAQKQANNIGGYDVSKI